MERGAYTHEPFRMGKLRHWLWPRPFRGGRSLGHMAHGLMPRWRRCESSTHPVEKSCQVRSKSHKILRSRVLSSLAVSLTCYLSIGNFCSASSSARRRLSTVLFLQLSYKARCASQAFPVILRSRLTLELAIWCISFLFSGQITTPKDFGHSMPEGFSYDTFYYAGYSVFFSGLSVGLTNIASG